MDAADRLRPRPVRGRDRRAEAQRRSEGLRRPTSKRSPRPNWTTVVGHIEFGSSTLPPFARRNVAKTPLVGGQWRLGADGKYTHHRRRQPDGHGNPARRQDGGDRLNVSSADTTNVTSGETPLPPLAPTLPDVAEAPPGASSDARPKVLEVREIYKNYGLHPGGQRRVAKRSGGRGSGRRRAERRRQDDIVCFDRRRRGGGRRRKSASWGAT